MLSSASSSVPPVESALRHHRRSYCIRRRIVEFHYTLAVVATNESQCTVTANALINRRAHSLCCLTASTMRFSASSLPATKLKFCLVEQIAGHCRRMYGDNCQHHLMTHKVATTTARRMPYDAFTNHCLNTINSKAHRTHTEN